MKKFLIFLMFFSSVCFAQGQLPRDRVYIGNDPQPGGSSPFQLTRSHANIQIINQSGDIEIRLPSSGIKKGETWTIQSRASGYLADINIKTYGGTELVETIGGGFIILTSLQDAPTAASHWYVLDIKDQYIWVSTWTFNGSGGTGGSKTLTAVRRKEQVTFLMGGASTATTGTGSTYFQANTSLPTRMIPQSSRGTTVAYKITNNPQSTYGYLVVVASSGLIQLYRDPTSAAWTNTQANSGFEKGFTFVYDLY